MSRSKWIFYQFLDFYEIIMISSDKDTNLYQLQSTSLRSLIMKRNVLKNLFLFFNRPKQQAMRTIGATAEMKVFFSLFGIAKPIFIT